MAKASAVASIWLSVLVAALCITSLVFSILIYDKVHKDKKKEPDDRPTTRAPPATTISPNLTTRSPTVTPHPILSSTSKPIDDDALFCPRYGPAQDTPETRKAAALIKSGLDENVDPCEDFYAFTCNKFIASHDVKKLKVGKVSASSELQNEIYTEIVKNMVGIKVGDQSQSKTERITKALLESCVYHATTKPNSTEVFLRKLESLFGGIPFIGHPISEYHDIFAAMGTLEQEHALSTLLGAMVTVDYKNTSQHALYLSQPKLPMPRDYYIQPQFTKKLADREQSIFDVMRKFADAILDDHEKYLNLTRESAREVARLEMNIAMASLPGSQLRNHAQLYNVYDSEELKKAYPAINWLDYFRSLMSTVGTTELYNGKKIIIMHPSYFGWLNALFAGDFDRKTIVNYMITQMIFEDADFLGGEVQSVAEKANYVPYAQRKGFGVTHVGGRVTRFNQQSDPNLPCMDLITTYMPFGPGYAYVKSKGDERNNIIKDVSEQTDRVIDSFLEMMSELDWMTIKSKEKTREKAKEMKKSYGWPNDLFGDFKDFSKIDEYHSDDYNQIIDQYIKNETYYKLRSIMIKGYSNRESLRLIKETPTRTRFMLSPAKVNAFYQPESNSITLPFANFNPPFYNYARNSPQIQAYNYAGEHAIAGHELVHGFDDEGVQFGSNGSLSDCGWNECGWMDRASKEGFKDMAQCVVSQYNTQCCPQKSGTTMCANGATTQGENIADLGGVQAAYRAFQKYAKTLPKQEQRLPGLEQYSPNQLFWITHGFGWCETRSEENMINQLLTNVHSPGICRVEQVVQDIPAFAKDFGCTVGQKMYPTPEQRCKVWVRD
ncbi:unnamed protein product [Cylicocyclus nassatus]|uniref:Uncharacterized protein n=1 Tax=Cylicocyclus nassatus TaxID=53992 RepID=A0AA36MDB8_CYLNA|nr:unnamed protein product [Cylicocyclus nassatus]